MTFDERVHAVQTLGFTTRQARFLVTVALHSGYCLRRQYAEAAGLRYGKNVCHFLDSLVTRQLAVRFTLRADRGHLYHLRSRTLYRALGQEDNRNRREGSAALVARKLMLLDYVLAHPDVEWLATEAEKVALFAERFGVPEIDLPQHLYAASDPRTPPTTRYFPHKLPVAVVGDPPVAHFVSLVTDTTGRGLEEFLQDHAPLLQRLPAWTVAAVGTETTLRFVRCDAVMSRLRESSRWTRKAEPDELRWYFRTRQAVDAGELAALSVADIDRFRDLRRQFSGANIDALYARWIQRGDDALIADPVVPPVGGSRVERLITEVLAFDYSQFGSLPGVA